MCNSIGERSILTVADLKGKTIGYSGGGVTHVALKTMLEQHHLTLNDVTQINIHYDLTQALLSKKVDAVTGMMRTFEVIQLQLLASLHGFFYLKKMVCRYIAN